MTEYILGSNDPVTKSVSVEGYIQRIAYNANSLPEYVGLARPGSATSAAVWQIRKFIYSGTNVTEINFAGSSVAFSQIWDDHASLSYS
jgi:hypothetical protein